MEKNERCGFRLNVENWGLVIEYVMKIVIMRNMISDKIDFDIIFCPVNQFCYWGLL